MSSFIQWFIDRPRAFALLIIAATCGAGYAGFQHLRSNKPAVVADAPVTAWYYDLDSSALVAGPSKFETLPIVNPEKPGSAAACALAHVFSCGDCGSEEKRFTGYLETRDPNPFSNEPILLARVPAKGKKPVWVTQSSAEGEKIEAQPRSRCGGASATSVCRP